MTQAEETISLSGARSQLQKARKGKLASATHEELLNLLKCGNICSGFEFDASGIRWIKIPSIFWAGVSSNEFKIIIPRKKSASAGAFKVHLHLHQFAEEISSQICAQTQSQKPTPTEELIKILEATSNSYEVRIKKTDWENYKASAHVTVQPSVNAKGREINKGWRKTLVIAAAYIVHHYRTKPRDKMKIAEASKFIHQFAEKDEKIAEVPASDTIRDELQEIFDTADQMDLT